MTIYTNNLVVNGTFSGSSLYANTMGGGSNAPINIMSDIAVNGNVLSKGRIETGNTLFMTMRATADVPLRSQEHFVIDNDMILDLTSSDAAAIAQVADYTTIWNWANGTFTVPVDGLYTLQLQGSFSNSVPDAKNGVYFYFKNHSYPTARNAATISSSPLVYTSTSLYLLKGDIVQPAFYSTDPQAVLLGNGESYLSFLIPATVNIDRTNYYRIDTSSNATQ